jgi:cephalosporin-C deacetylase-like acetyl esterase
MVSTKFTILTDPPGADIYLKEYADIEGEWRFLGVTPIDSIRMPVRTFYRWKIEKPGYETVVAIAATSIDTLYRKLDEKGTIPPGMVRVIGQNTDEGMIPDFYIDKYEVTNKQFKEFLNAGGYQKQDYWKHKFVKDGRVLTWEEAMDEFRDLTGRSGPSSWQAGDYPDGQDDYPVTGVSWYEAAAYVEFLGKSLPTVHHWGIAAGFNIIANYMFSSRLIPLSNFKGSGAVPVGSSQGVNCFGAYDMAGNVREWCWNESQEGRFIRGGAWNDVFYMYSNESQLPSFNRSSKNGFRGVRYIDRDKITENIFQQIEYTGLRDYYKEEPVSDAIFKVYKNQFLYDKTELDAVVYETDESSDDWTIEKITFNAAYGNELVIAYLYLPKATSPPYQTVIFFPGGGAAREGSIKDNLHVFWFFDFILKNGRAVMFPVYKGTFERNNGLTNEMRWPNQSHGHTEYLIKWVKDLSRSIDYLETRPDIDSNKLVYFGQSWGGHLGAIIPAVEERLKVSILRVGGLTRSTKALPEADEVNYISRVKIPVLMLNGRYDYYYPLETSVKPMYDLLGTPEADKDLKIYETDHFVPKNEMIKETLDWLDKYFGPVNR